MAQLEQLLEPYEATRVAHGVQQAPHSLSMAVLRAKLLTEVLVSDSSHPADRRR